MVSCVKSTDDLQYLNACKFNVSMCAFKYSRPADARAWARVAQVLATPCKHKSENIHHSSCGQALLSINTSTLHSSSLYHNVAE